MRIMIADDDRVLNRLIEHHLREEGFETRAVHDATQTWTQLTASPPEMLIPDVKMPGGTGLEDLRKMKCLPRTAHIPVVVITAMDDPILLGKLREHRPDALLAKPVAMAQWDEEIARLLGSRKE
jgi:two-component system cell cycle response regulator